MTGASRSILLSRLVGLFGELEAIARRMRHATDAAARTPFSVIHTTQYDLELVTILTVIDSIRETLRQIDGRTRS